MTDYDAAIAAYEPLLEQLARPFVGRDGAELDDLVQEGRIAVWQSLGRGICPTAGLIENRMRDYLRALKPQTPATYETLLPMDDFRGVHPED